MRDEAGGGGRQALGHAVPQDYARVDVTNGKHDSQCKHHRAVIEQLGLDSIAAK